MEHNCCRGNISRHDCLHADEFALQVITGTVTATKFVWINLKANIGDEKGK